MRLIEEIHLMYTNAIAFFWKLDPLSQRYQAIYPFRKWPYQYGVSNFEDGSISEFFVSNFIFYIKSHSLVCETYLLHYYLHSINPHNPKVSFELQNARTKKLPNGPITKEIIQTGICSCHPLHLDIQSEKLWREDWGMEIPMTIMVDLLVMTQIQYTKCCSMMTKAACTS